MLAPCLCPCSSSLIDAWYRATGKSWVQLAWLVHVNEYMMWIARVHHDWLETASISWRIGLQCWPVIERGARCQETRQNPRCWQASRRRLVIRQAPHLGPRWSRLKALLQGFHSMFTLFFLFLIVLSLKRQSFRAIFTYSDDCKTNSVENNNILHR